MIGHAIGDEKEEDNRHEEDKPVRRAIRQRRFKKGELALARHPESRKWVVVKVLEALPSGRCVRRQKKNKQKAEEDGMDPCLQCSSSTIGDETPGCATLTHRNKTNTVVDIMAENRAN